MLGWILPLGQLVRRRLLAAGSLAGAAAVHGHGGHGSATLEDAGGKDPIENISPPFRAPVLNPFLPRQNYLFSS